eukprot:1198056-Alexandrium_andersonii.AAC.1
MAFSHLLVSALVVLTGAQQEECLPTGECEVPSAATAMLQSRTHTFAKTTDEVQEHTATTECV